MSTLATMPRNPETDVTIAKAISKTRMTDMTAIMFKRGRPRAYAAVVNALAEPRDIFPYRWIVQRYRASYGTIRAVEIAEAETLQTQKKNIGDLMLNVSEQAATKALELIPKLGNAAQAMMVAGVGFDKFLLSRDQATQRIAVDLNAGNIHEDIKKLLAQNEQILEGEWEKMPEQPKLEDKAA